MKTTLIFGFGITACVFACGGISDPERSAAGTPTAQVQGTLKTGSTSLPAGAHIALVWVEPDTNQLVVVEDAAVTNNRFTIPLTTPGEQFFEGMGQARKDVSLPAPGIMTTSDGTSGAIGGAELEQAIAGFVVYVDQNGNGKLDLSGRNGDSPDQIVASSKDFVLTYFRGGDALDYEKLRDKAGMLPSKGYNLAWQSSRWMKLDLVELSVDDRRLPSVVCHGGGFDGGIDETNSGGIGDGTAVVPSGPNTSGGTGDAGTHSHYPSPDDVTCSPDGRSFQTKNQCPPPPPPATGVCAPENQTFGCATAEYPSLRPDAGVPEGWPCAVPGGTPELVDGGAFDASASPDSGKDAGPIILDAGAD